MWRNKKALTPKHTLAGSILLEKWPSSTTWRQSSLGCAQGQGGRRCMGKCFQLFFSQRMPIYLVVKLPLDRRCWAHHSKHQSNQVDTHTESGPGSGHTCLCSCRETCCIDPEVTAEGKTHMKYGKGSRKQRPENKLKMQRKAALQYWLDVALKRAGQYFPNLSQVFYWQSHMPRKVQVYRGINPRWQHYFRILTPYHEGGSLAGLVWENQVLSQTRFLVPH